MILPTRHTRKPSVTNTNSSIYYIINTPCDHIRCIVSLVKSDFVWMLTADQVLSRTFNFHYVMHTKHLYEYLHWFAYLRKHRSFCRPEQKRHHCTRHAQRPWETVGWSLDTPPHLAPASLPGWPALSVWLSPTGNNIVWLTHLSNLSFCRSYISPTNCIPHTAYLSVLSFDKR